MNCGRMQNFWEIHRESDLAAEPGARNIFAPEHAEIESHAIANCVLTANQSLELASAQIAVFGKASVDLGAERQPGSEVVQDRETSRVNVAPCALYAHRAGAGVTSEQVAEVPNDPGLVRKGFLRDQVEPVVGQS